MRALPDDGWKASESGDGAPPLPGPWRKCGTVRHTFTHFTVELDVLALPGRPTGDPTDYPTGDPTADPTKSGEWWPLGRLEEAGLPTLFAKAATLVLAETVQTGPGPFIPD